ncbi:MAG: hypothetical protein ACR2M4_05250 [Actinomycetota bacterium]
MEAAALGADLESLVDERQTALQVAGLPSALCILGQANPEGSQRGRERGLLRLGLGGFPAARPRRGGGHAGAARLPGGGQARRTCNVQRRHGPKTLCRLRGVQDEEVMGDEQSTGGDRGQAQAEGQAVKEAARRTPLLRGAWHTLGSLEEPSQDGSARRPLSRRRLRG